MIIRRLQQEDARVYQELRLEGLCRSPDAFGSTYEREAAFSLDTVMERITPSADRFVLGAFETSDRLLRSRPGEWELGKCCCKR